MTYAEVINGHRPFNDAEWICSDRNGELGVFVSAGFGPIPRTAYINECEYDRLLDWLAKLDIDIADPTPRGIFVYDYSGETGNYGWYDQKYSYRRVWAERSSERIECEDWVIEIAKRNRMLAVDFKVDDHISVERHFEHLNL